MVRLFSWMLLVPLVLVGWIGCKIKDTPKAVVNDEKKEVVVGSVTTKKIIWEKGRSQMALIPAGSFRMGDHFNEGRDDGRELPVHTVELDAFYIDVKEVTVGQFREFVNRSGYQWVVARARPDYRKTWDRAAEYSPGDEYPMVYVNWGDARAYAKWAG
ncbi:MAG: SUMF1/EgtB/PvdO family nonheme iron enzyme, partial [Candidatus Poribacteria bacterium]|nr:SUMF1/EgtB/PvdO family nonheme iron enzyme [Candidatus Poribacteria bacterium]